MLEASLHPAILDRDGLTLNPTEFAQSLNKGCGPLGLRRRSGSAKQSNGRQLRLLRARDEWPRRRRAAEQRDELATTDHSINSSARSKVRHGPIALTSTFQSDHDTDSRFSAFIRRVLHIDAHNDVRIFGARLRPFALNNFCLFDLSKKTLHEYSP